MREATIPHLPTLLAMGESLKRAIDRSGHNNDLREATSQASSLIISLKEAASYAPCAKLQKAAAGALIIFESIQVYNLITYDFNDSTLFQDITDNKEAYKRLGDDSAALIVAIWRSYKEAESQLEDEWLSAEMQEILIELMRYDRLSS